MFLLSAFMETLIKLSYTVYRQICTFNYISCYDKSAISHSYNNLLCNTTYNSLNKFIGARRIRSLCSYVTDVLKDSEDVFDKQYVQKYFPELNDLSENELGNAVEVLQILQNKAAVLDDIKKHLWILSYCPKKIESKLSLLRYFGVKDLSIPLLRFSEGKLKKTKYLEGGIKSCKLFPNRVTFLSNQLEISETEVVKILEQNTFLFTARESKLKGIIETTKEAGFTARDILRDLRVFKFRVDGIADRIKRANAIGIPLKMWMLRCEEKIFCAALERWTKKKQVLGSCNDVTEYLAKRLECSNDCILKISRKYPQVTSVKPPKLKQMLDYLFSKGVTPSQICKWPYILNFGVSTIQQRLTALEVINHQVSSLKILCSSPENFQHIIESHTLKKQKSKTSLLNSNSVAVCSSGVTSSNEIQLNEVEANNLAAFIQKNAQSCARTV